MCHLERSREISPFVSLSRDDKYSNLFFILPAFLHREQILQDPFVGNLSSYS